jgi:hypothetical protein
MVERAVVDIQTFPLIVTAEHLYMRAVVVELAVEQRPYPL